MRRATPLSRPLTDAEYSALTEHEEYVVPAEAKEDSWGVLEGRIVAVDYGN